MYMFQTIFSTNAVYLLIETECTLSRNFIFLKEHYTLKSDMIRHYFKENYCIESQFHQIGIYNCKKYLHLCEDKEYLKSIFSVTVFIFYCYF